MAAECLRDQCGNYRASLANNADPADVVQVCETERGGPQDGICRAPVVTGLLGTVELFLASDEKGGAL